MSSGMGETNTTPRFDDGRANNRISPVRRAYASGTGRRETSRVHCMLEICLWQIQRWARATLTFVHEEHRATYDYIFYTHENLLPTRVLSIPATNDLGI